MNRLEKFQAFSTHPWHHKNFRKLKPAEVELALAFIRENDSLEKLPFEAKVNRLWLDQPSARPKRWTIIIELLSCCNT